MKALTKRFAIRFCLSCIGVAVLQTGVVATAGAADLYWDANGTATGTGGTGVWTTANTWRSGSDTGTLQAWANANNAFFAGTSGSVQVASGSAAMSAVNLNTTTDGYTLYTSSQKNGLTVTGTLTIASNVGLTLQSQSNSASDTVFSVNTFSTSSGSSLTLNVTPSSGTTFGSFRVDLTGANASMAAATNITSTAGLTSGLIGYAAQAKGVSISGGITNNSNATTMIGASSSNDLTLSSTAVISGSAGLQFSVGINGGAGTTTLNAQNTYNGATTFNLTNSGIVKLGIDNALPTSTNVTMAASSGYGGILDLNGHNQTVASLTSGAGGGSITNNATGTGTNTLTVSGNTSPAAFALAITDGTTAKTALTRSGTGTLTLTGANTYTGGTTVNGGVLNVNTGGTLGGSAGSLTVNAATGVASALNLNVSQTVNGLSGTIAGTGTATITIASGFVLNSTQSGSTEYDGILAGSGGLTKAGAGTLSLTNQSNTYAGGTIINGGALAINGPNILGSTSGALTINNGTFQLTTIGGTGSGISSGRNIMLGNANSTIQVDTSLGYTATSAAVVSGTGTLNKTGAGGLALAGANTYSGGTSVTAGTLLVNNTTGSGTGSGAVNVSAGRFGGTGTSTGAVTIASGATISPGATGGSSIGKLTVGDGGPTTGFTLNGTMLINLAVTSTPTAGTNYGQISTVGALTLNSTSALTVNVTANSGLAVGQVLYVALNDGIDPVVGTLNGQIEGSTYTDSAGDTYTLSYLGNGDAGTLGNDISLTVTGVTPVPEPATCLGGVLLVGAVGWNQRRRLRGLFAGRRSQVMA